MEESAQSVRNDKGLKERCFPPEIYQQGMSTMEKIKAKALQCQITGKQINSKTNNNNTNKMK